ncbi:MAG: SDR family NAD(P)-dependent oxidoreductase [Zoogloeaceae bacterium]|nr:SDR family NAD(P)-dependent oxidoreductase [Zoogloeaceae bacterium]
MTEVHHGSDMAPVWLITGCSTGLGRELARCALECGYRVVVTARGLDAVKDFAAFEQALVLELDVTDLAQVRAAVGEAEKRFGRIDVLVNNAGIGYFAAIEEGEEAEARRMFEINVFGLCRMTRAVLPGMRARRDGVIVNLSSLAGIWPGPGMGYYAATKHAVEGLSGALAREVAHLGVKVIAVEPSGLRTDWAKRSENETTARIEEYAAVTADVRREQMRARAGDQPGDPRRAARAILEAVRAPNPPRHLPLGNAAYEMGSAHLESVLADFRAGEAVARAIDAP